MGKKVGKILKVDACTSATLRGWYARLCIQVSLDVPFKSEVTIGRHKQAITYEWEGFLCTSCGKLGHVSNAYLQGPTSRGSTTSNTLTAAGENECSWQTVKLNQRRKKTKKHNNASQYPAQNVKVKSFDAGPGKFLESPSLRFNPTPNDGASMSGVK